MENSSLPSDVWNNTTTSAPEGGKIASNLFWAGTLQLKVIYSIIAVIGIIDNLFVIIVFVFFTKIADKVFTSHKM